MTTGWGTWLALLAALISGLAIYLNGFAVKQLPDPAVYTTLKNAVAALLLVFFAIVSAGGLAGLGRDLRGLDARSRVGLLVVGVVGGSLPFILFFTGLALASGPSAAFIQKTLFIWVALLAVPFLAERLGLAQVVALAVLLVGQALILPPRSFAWGGGEALILAATLLWAVESVVAKRLLGSIAAPTVAAGRMAIGLVVLAAYLAVTGKLAVVAGLGAEQWGWALLTGLILAGYVGVWFSALSRAPVSTVTSVLVVGALVTGLLGALTKGAAPDPTVVGGYVLVVLAVGTIAGRSIRQARAGALQSVTTVAGGPVPDPSH